MKKSTPDLVETRKLFDNNNPDEVWVMAVDIVRHINPAHDLSLLRTTFDDVVRMFRGEYPGYAAIATAYHDLSHTLSVFMCAIRLMHGVHVSGTPLTEQEMTSIMLAALLHDVGYAQQLGSETGTGAQFTKIHVSRGIQFMQRYAVEQDYPAALAASLEFLLQSTDHMRGFSNIIFPDERTRMLGQIVSTADLVGQMADRLYLEKLMFLYFEFKEAGLGNYKNIRDLLSKSFAFYEHTQRKLDADLGGMVDRLPHHFREWYGTERNYYTDSIGKNIAYLTTVIESEETEFLAMLKRGDVANRLQTGSEEYHA